MALHERLLSFFSSAHAGTLFSIADTTLGDQGQDLVQFPRAKEPVRTWGVLGPFLPRNEGEFQILIYKNTCSRRLAVGFSLNIQERQDVLPTAYNRTVVLSISIY